MSAELASRSVRGGVAMLSGQAIRFAVQLGSMAVLARLLGPDEFGAVAIATAVVAFALCFTDMGLTAATVQAKTLTRGQLSTVFWVNVGFAAVLAVGMVAAAPLLADLFHDRRLQGAIVGLSVTILLSGLSAQPTAILQRSMRFGTLSAISVLASIAGAAAAIAVALAGAGYWALVILACGTSLATACGVWIFARWRPGLPRRGSGARPMIDFGAHYAGFNFLNYFARKADDLLIGWALGTVPLGLYNRAYQLLSAPMTHLNAPASGVVVPALSRLQSRPKDYVEFYRGAVGLLAGIGMPVVAFLLVAAEDVVLFVFGPKWEDAVPIFQALGPAAFVCAGNMVAGWVYGSLGNTRRMLRWGLIAVPVTVASFVAGLPYGAVGVALSYSAAIVCLWFGSMWFCFRGTPLRMRDPLSAMWRPFAAAAAAALCAYAARPGSVAGLPALRIVVDGAMFGACYLGAWSLLPGGRVSVKSASRVVLRAMRVQKGDSRVSDARSMTCAAS